MSSKVYFANMRTSHKNSLLDKVDKLIKRCGIDQVVAPKDLVAIKVHFGEQGNTGYIRPQFIRRVVDMVHRRQGKPFITDANTLYVGSRANAVDHLVTALENGFAFAVVNAPLIIADGLNGKDYINVPVNLKHFSEVKIGSAVVHADALIAVSHFKGHEATGFGGTLKNLGMGCGCRSGKQMMHSDVLPKVSEEKCVGCARCTHWCPGNAITVQETKKARIDENKCIGCGECTVTCPEQAIAINWRTQPDIIQEKIVEYTAGVLKNKQGKAGFITFVTSVSPDCDCFAWTDAPIVRDIGILASLDPVALDQACVDLVNNEPGLSNSRLAGHEHAPDKFMAIHPNVDWRRQLAYAEEIGLGTRQYELITID
ncbi:DUF362 domain-containing protein [Desulfurispora thermophila]|uniref:DUF362 domain-containing protein n=1 Tax=Desulfurispora thermophila TaxID=265470 RepID=UPI00047559A3|nr:DUF362 domain-containing protein [Desulfurispora thermophila]